MKFLLNNLSPVLDESSYVFLTFAEARYGELSRLDPIVTIREDEGLALVVPKDRADSHGHDYHGVYKKITL